MEQIPLTLETPASISPEKNQHKTKPLAEKSVPGIPESQLPLDFSSQNFDSYTEQQLSQEYEKRVGVPLRPARYDRQGVIGAIKNPREERDLLFAEDEASRKEDLKSPYSR
jgi:hypothetical protein